MQLTPEQINEFIANAVLESQLGEAVKASVARVMDDMRRSFSNPFDEVIKRHVAKVVEELVSTQYRTVLEEGIKTRLAEAMTDEVFEKIIEAAIERFKRNSY